MRTPIFQIDAFTACRFRGNPAAVMPMDSFLSDAVLQAIASENNLAETAFLVSEVVRALAPDMAALAHLDRDGVIVTAPGGGAYDFVSRYFAPAKGIPEDPVTGGAHCMLAPYWGKRLGKTMFRAYQASHRGGEIICRLDGERVQLQGTCVFYLEGEVQI
jgi:predicted PhzF superfamily epimerase YddE/YHI9